MEKVFSFRVRNIAPASPWISEFDERANSKEIKSVKIVELNNSYI